jgi:adenylate cyclase
MEALPLERKLVAILAADVASYSRLMEIDEERTFANLSAFRLVTDGLISRHEGRICGTAATAFLPRSAARWRQSSAQSTGQRFESPLVRKST